MHKVKIMFISTDDMQKLGLVKSPFGTETQQEDSVIGKLLSRAAGIGGEITPRAETSAGGKVGG